MNPGDIKILTRMADTIRKRGTINMTDLWKSTDLSIWQFNVYKKLLTRTFDDIELDRKKNYVSRNNISLFSKEELK